MNNFKPTTGCFLAGGLMAAYPLALMCRTVVNKLALVVDSMEQNVHKSLREKFYINFVTVCLGVRICDMARLACIVQSHCSDRELDSFTTRPRPQGMGEARNPLRRNR